MYKKIAEVFDYNFNVDQDGLYSIEIEATGGRGQHLKVELDERDLKGIMPSKKDQYYTIPPDWNGNLLRGIAKIVVLVTNLSQGEHTLRFKPKGEVRILFEPKIKLLPKEGLIRILENIQSAEKDRQEWITIALVDLPLKTLEISVTCQKRFWESDDVQLVIDDKVQKNSASSWWGKYWFWQGRRLKGIPQTDTFSLELEKGLHYVELWADKTPYLNFLKLTTITKTTGDNNSEKRDEEWWKKYKVLKEYTYKGISGDENYNRYDELIKNVVAHWNNEFFSQAYPPDEPLDPNLVKSMVYQESRTGYEERNNGHINVMQVGNYGDPSLEVLNGKAEAPEYELINGQLWKVDYNGQAKVNEVYDSIYWGTRWLYHKAQSVGKDGKRYWSSWKDAVKEYGPPRDEYAENVWSIYTDGIDKRSNPWTKIWILSFLFSALLSTFHFQSLKAEALASFDSDQKIRIKDVSITPDWGKPNLFLATIIHEKDWWEYIKVGQTSHGKVKWLSIEDEPTEQSILNAKFINLSGFDNDILEVYGQTHVGHGAFYLYTIENDQVKLLLETPAVDMNLDTRWAPDNYEKYGYGNCGEKFKDDKLQSDYKDINGDGILDVVLSGTQEVICEKDPSEKLQPEENKEIKISESSIRKTFLWNEKEQKYLQQ